MASNYRAGAHEIGITDIGTDGTGTDVLGFRLLEDETGVPIYEEFDDHYLAQQFFSSGASYANTPPERRLIHSQGDFRAGMGLEVFDAQDPFRYFSSIGCDLRHRGQAIAGWNSTAITVNTVSAAANLANTDMELTSSWTGGQGRSSTQKHGGSYSWWCNGAQQTASQSATTWATDWQSKPFYFECWVWSDTTAGRVGIYDGVGTTWSSSHAGNSAWALLTVHRTLDASASELTIRLNNNSGSGNSYFDDCAILSPAAGTTPAHADFNDKLYIAVDKTIFKLNTGNDEFDPVRTFPATITDLEPFQVSGTDYLFIFLGTSDAYWYMTTGEAFTESNATDNTYKFSVWVHTTVDTLYANDGDNTVRSTTNPLNGGVAWSGQTVVGEASIPFTGLLAKSGALYMPKEDLTYYLDSSGNVQNDLDPERVTSKATHSGKNAIGWLGELFIPCGDQELLRIGTTNEWINPAKSMTNLGDFSGQVEAVAGDGEYLYAIIDNSAKIEVLAGRDETVAGSSPATAFRWHGIHELTLTGCETAWISTVLQKRLWITSTNSSDSIYYLPIPTKYGDITNDSNASFKTDTYFITPWIHNNFKTDTKAFVKITASLGHTYDVNIYWECHYEKLGDTSFTDAGDLKGTSTSRTAQLFFSGTPDTPMFRLKFVAKTDDTSKTPILLSLTVESILYPPVGSIIACSILVEEESLSKQGITSNRTSTHKTTLDNARNATKPVSIRDIDGTTRNVKFLPLPQNIQRRRLLKAEKSRKRAWVYNVLMQEITTS